MKWIRGLTYVVRHLVASRQHTRTPDPDACRRRLAVSATTRERRYGSRRASQPSAERLNGKPDVHRKHKAATLAREHRLSRPANARQGVSLALAVLDGRRTDADTDTPRASI